MKKSLDNSPISMEKESIKSLEEIDPLIHEPVRLGILVLLLPRPKGLAFNTIQEILDVSPGNLSSHAQKLFQAKYISIIKLFVNFKPKTFYKITEHGEKALKTYANNLGSLIYSVIDKRN